MKKVVSSLKKWASGKVVWGLLSATLAVYVTILFYTIPAVMYFAPEKVLFDLSPLGYSFEEAKSLLDALGPEGRSIYLNLQLPMDFVYPGLSAISYSLFLTWVFSKGFEPNSKMFYFAVIPFFAGFFDYLENIGIVQIIHSYPDLSRGLVDITSIFTLLKSGFTTVFFILFFLGCFKVVKKRFFTKLQSKE